MNMPLPTPINWLQQKVAVPTLFPESNTGQALMLFHTDNFFNDDEEMASLIRSCVFHANSAFNDIWYEGIIKDSDRMSVQNFLLNDERFKEFGRAYQADGPNWMWITDTLMNILDKLEFTEDIEEKDVRFWMLVQEYYYDQFDEQHYNRKGRCHILLIETNNLENWEPTDRYQIPTIQGESVYSLPPWIYDLGSDDDEY